MIDKHKFEQKYNNFGYLSAKFWLKVTTRANIKKIHSVPTAILVKSHFSSKKLKMQFPILQDSDTLTSSPFLV